MCPTSVRLKKEAAGGGLGFVCMWGRQMGQGNLKLEQKKQALHAIGLKCCFAYLEEGMEKKSADENILKNLKKKREKTRKEGKKRATLTC